MHSADSPAHTDIVDSIFPTNQIHLIFGPQARDKTILLLQIMRDWTLSRPVFSHVSHPSHYCWVSCERNTDSLHTHMHRLGISPPDTFHFSLLDTERRDNQTIEAAVAIAFQRTHASVLFIDGLHALCPGRIIDSHDVTTFLVHVQQLMRERHVTIIATAASPKFRPEDAATPPGERFLGSGSWASMTDTKILIEPYDSLNLSDPTRRITVMPTHSPAIIDKYEHQSTGLIWVGVDDAGATGLDKWLALVPLGELVTTPTIQTVAKDIEVSRASCTRWIRAKVDEGFLEQDSRGVFVVSRPKTQ